MFCVGLTLEDRTYIIEHGGIIDKEEDEIGTDLRNADLTNIDLADAD